MINKPNGSANGKSENAEWEKFKKESDEKILNNEKRVGEYKQQAGKMKKSVKTNFDKNVSDLEKKNNVLKQKMKNYSDDRTDRQEKFTNDFSKGMNELTR